MMEAKRGSEASGES